VLYRVVSADGHPIGGGFTFRVGQASEEVDPTLLDELLAGSSTDRGVGVASSLFRFLAFAGLLVLLGGAAAASTIWPAGARERRVRRLLAGGLALLGVSTAALIGLQAADVAGLGLTDALRPSIVADELGRRYGLLSVARLLLLVPAGFLLLALARGAWRQAWWRAAGAALALAIAAVTALNGHAAGGRWQGPALVADVVHLLAAAAWLGGLAVVAFALLRGGDDAARVGAPVRRFSSVALWSVAVLVVTGAFQSVRQVGGLEGLDTTYGRLLLGKLVAVGGLVALAALSRQVVRHRLAEEDGVVELRRTVGVETGLAVLVVAVTALLVDATPARSQVLEPVSVSRVVDGIVVDVEVVPATTGPNDFHVYAQDPSAGLTGDLDATATLSLPGTEIEGIEVPLVAAGRGHWSAYDLDVPVAGTWVLQLRVVSGGSFVELDVDVPVR
jgi:copper transport protein